jgi:hypothetical protein
MPHNVCMPNLRQHTANPVNISRKLFIAPRQSTLTRQVYTCRKVLLPTPT